MSIENCIDLAENEGYVEWAAEARVELDAAHAGLLRALDYRAATPEGLAIRADVRDALRLSGFTGPMGEMGS